MYVGKYERNAELKGESLIMSDFIFQRMDEQSYNARLKEDYETHLAESGRSYFQG